MKQHHDRTERREWTRPELNPVIRNVQIHTMYTRWVVASPPPQQVVSWQRFGLGTELDQRRWYISAAGPQTTSLGMRWVAVLLATVVSPQKIEVETPAEGR